MYYIINNYLEVQQSIIEKIPLANHLRGMMTNIDNYDKLNKKLV